MRMRFGSNKRTKFGENAALKRYRLQAGLSQGRLAALVGCHQSQITYLEQGLTKTSAEWARRLATTLSAQPNMPTIDPRELWPTENKEQLSPWPSPPQDDGETASDDEAQDEALPPDKAEVGSNGREPEPSPQRYDNIIVDQDLMRRAFAVADRLIDWDTEKRATIAGLTYALLAQREKQGIALTDNEETISKIEAAITQIRRPR